MIEIILRQDIDQYEPRSFLGRTKREVLTLLCVGVLCLATCLALTALGLPIAATGWVLIVEGFVGAFIGLARFGGQTATSYAARRFREFCLPTHLPAGMLPCPNSPTQRKTEVIASEIGKDDKKSASAERELGEGRGQGARQGEPTPEEGA